jgi:hypothetical protein
MPQDLLRIYLTDKYALGFELSSIVWAIAAALLLLSAASHFRRGRKPYQVIQLNIQLGNIGSVQMKPNWEDIQVAHRIWTELVTRKAAIPIDPDNDVISEIYISWYALFQKIRQLISDIPSSCIRKEKSTQELVRIAIETLNLGLRPHLTKWQARYGNWWSQTESELKTKSPQEHQKEFPQFSELLKEMLIVNQQLIQYAGELEKLVRARS